MGALASNRKRGADEYFNFNFSHKNKHPYSKSLDFQISKKPRFSLMNGRPEKAILSSNNTVSRISRYPEAKLPFPREVHAPVRHLKFRLSASNPNQEPFKSYIGNFRRTLISAEGQAFDALGYFKKEKEVIFVEDDEKKQKEVVSDYCSAEEVDAIENGKNNVEEEERQVQPSSSVVTELNNGSLRMEHALNEKRIAGLQALRPEWLHWLPVSLHKKADAPAQVYLRWEMLSAQVDLRWGHALSASLLALGYVSSANSLAL